MIMSTERPKFYLYCPKCNKKYPGKKMMRYYDNKTCSCGYTFTENEMNNQLKQYQAKRKIEKMLKQEQKRKATGESENNV